MQRKSVLVLDATGRLGVHLLCASNNFFPRPEVHAFTTDPSSLSDQNAHLCHSVHKGQLTSASDVSTALRASAASVVILPVDPHRNDAPPSTLPPNPPSKRSASSKPIDARRFEAARALMDALDTLNAASPASSAPPAPESETRGDSNVTLHPKQTKIILVSALGAGGTSLRFTLGLGKLMTMTRRAELYDHDAAEREIRTRLGPDAKNRLLIVRPAAMTDTDGTGSIRVFQRGRVAAPWIARKDVAEWIMQQAYVGKFAFGHEVCVCTDRGRKEKRWVFELKPSRIQTDT